MNIPPLCFVRFARPAPIIQRGIFWYSVYRHLRLLVSPALLGDLECFIKFYDVGAFVWFAHIIEWEFPKFSVDKCFEPLLEMQKKIDTEGCIEGTIHRYLIVAQKIA